MATLPGGKPPTLHWLAAEDASQYNVQLFRGKTRILGAWQKRTKLTLHRAWRYGPSSDRCLAAEVVGGRALCLSRRRNVREESILCMLSALRGGVPWEVGVAGGGLAAVSRPRPLKAV